MLLSDTEENFMSQKTAFNQRENHSEFTSHNREYENNREALNR